MSFEGNDTWRVLSGCCLFEPVLESELTSPLGGTGKRYSCCHFLEQRVLVGGARPWSRQAWVPGWGLGAL